MNKKYIVAGISCAFIIISGICYSCTYHEKKDAVLISGLQAEGQSAELQKEGQSSQEQGMYDENLSSAKDFDSTEADPVLTNKQQGLTDELLIYVHLCGAVANPGVYEVKSNVRLVDIIELSGGLLEEAAADYINQAQQVSDGERIYIPTKDEIKDLSVDDLITGEQTEESSKADEASLININTATMEDLMKLPGIGQAKAGSIIEYRKLQGDFAATEDLMKIPGIKEGLYQKIASYITVK